MHDTSLSPERHRDLQSRGREVWSRRVVLTAIFLVLVAALLNVFGQRAQDTRAAGSRATMSVRAPTHVRGGLLYQARFTIHARAAISDARLILGSGWFDGLTINSLNPTPTDELNRDGRVVLVYGRLAAGQQLRVWLQYQVNPTNVGRQAQTAELDDGATPLARLRQDLTVYP